MTPLFGTGEQDITVVASPPARAQIEQLLAESEQVEEDLAALQTDGNASRTHLVKARRTYLNWYSRALVIIGDESQPVFRNMYEGGTFTPRVHAYLDGALDDNPLYDASKPGPFSPFKYDFTTTARPSIAQQRALLTERLHASSALGPRLAELASILRRFPEFLRTLRRYDSDQVPATSITSETGLQVALHAILRLLYVDVRAEDYVSQHAGSNSRVDFLVADFGIIIETKMTRPGLRDRKVGEELLVDWGRYKRHPDCKAILAMVYDPERFIDNPAALENSLSDSEAEVPTMALVVY